VATAILTAVYMFRLVFLAFHGEPRGPRGLDGHDAHLHDAPPAMALALVVLAAGSLLAGYVGVPHALGGSNQIERFLEPSFQAEAVAEGEAAVHASTALELGLMGVSIAAALGGIALAFVLFLRRREMADMLAERFAGVHRLLLNKYYVDEFYDAVVVQPIHVASEDGLWKRVDVGWIDGVVNGVGEGVRGSGELLRRLQTGSVRAYAASLMLGAVLVIGYYLW
jgi:NADH-quinone oxidoreductase subunit L